MANMAKGSYIAIENPTGLLGEWLEDEAETAGKKLNMTEGFENKWAKKSDIRQTLITADGNDKTSCIKDEIRHYDRKSDQRV